MNGPPTPPAEPVSLPEVPPEASSSTETQPADVPPPYVPVPAPALAEDTSPSPYQTAFPEIEAAVSKGDYLELIRIAELADLSPTHVHDEGRLLITVPLVLSYLIVDDLPPARYALTRLPEKTKESALVRHTFALLASVWEQRHVTVYARAEALYSYARDPSFPVAGLAAVVSTQTEAFVDAFRARTFSLIAKAYTSITLPLAQTYLGLTQDALLAASSNHGWTFDPATQLLTPAQALHHNTQSSSGVSGPSTVATLEQITDSVATLAA